MDANTKTTYQEMIDRGQRAQAWLSLETTQEFLKPLKDKIAELKALDYNDILGLDDKTFRSKVEASFLAAKEIEDFFAYLDDTLLAAEQARIALDGKDVDDY
jgi:hypothetical protein